MPLIREGFPMYCAHFPGGDPRRFEPDEECATPEEIERWKATCADADRRDDLAEIDGARVDIPGVGWVHLTMFGPGVFYYPEDPDEGEEYFEDEPSPAVPVTIS